MPLLACELIMACRSACKQNRKAIIIILLISDVYLRRAIGNIDFYSSFVINLKHLRTIF